MFQVAISNSTLSEEVANSLHSFNPANLLLQNTTNHVISSTPTQQQPPPVPKKVKKKRSLPGNPDPDAEVIALSPKSLLATNRFICEICNKGFQRDQNLQLHRRGHNLPWKLKQRSKDIMVRKKAYVCPETTCVHHHPSRALGDLTGIKKHFCRKHCEKKFKCEKCAKIYAVQSDWKAHSKTCGTREYRCDCGTLFSRKDSFITHRAFCDALAEESARLSTNPFSNPILPPPPPPQPPPPPPSQPNFANLTTTQNPNSSLFPFYSWDPPPQNPNPNNPNPNPFMQIKTENHHHHHFSPPSFFQPPPPPPFTPDTATATSSPFLSATALLQKAATLGAVTQAQALMAGFDELGHNMGPTTSSEVAAMPPLHPPPPPSSMTTTTQDHYNTMLGLASLATWRKNDDFTRDFLGLTAGDNIRYGNATDHGDHHHHHNDDDDDDVEDDMLKFTGGLQYGMTATYDRDNSSLLFKPHHHDQVDQGFGFVAPNPTASQTRWG